MTVFNFTLRAEDDRGAFSDRQFSIKVRNTLVDRYMVVDDTHAYTSLDLINWTERPDMGGKAVTYGGGNWMVWRGNNTYRMSPDGINWTQHVAQKEEEGVRSNIPAFTSCPVWKNDRWFGATQTGGIHAVYESVDGITWTLIASNIVTVSVSYFVATITAATNGALIINWLPTAASHASLAAPYPYVSFDNGRTWEVAIKSLPAGLVHQNAHYSNQVIHRSSILTFINGLWYYAYSAQRTYYSTSYQNAYAARYHYIGYSHDLVNFTRCDTDTISTTAQIGSAWNSSTAIGGNIRDIYYANGVLVLDTFSPFGSTAAGHFPTFPAYSVDGRKWTASTLPAPMLQANTTMFTSQGKVYNFNHAFGTLRVSGDNGRVFAAGAAVPSSTLNDFARI